MTEGHQVGNAVMPREDYDLMQIVLVCLDDENKAEKDSILRMLSVLLSEKLAAQEKKNIAETPLNSAASRAALFPPSASGKKLDLPPVNLRFLPLHLTKNSLASEPPHLISVSLKTNTRSR